MGIGQVAAQIRAIIADLAEAQAAATTAAHRLVETARDLAGISEGSSSELPADALVDAGDRATGAAASMRRARELLWSYLRTVAPAALAGSTLPAAGGALPDSAAASSTESAATAGEPPMDIPDHVRRCAARLPFRAPDDRPKPPGERNDPTHGIATDDDADNAEITGLLRSGRRAPVPTRTGLRVDYPWGNSLDHVEAQVAALMRRDGRRNVTVVINNVTCNPDQPDRDSRTGEVRRNVDGSVRYKRYTCDEQLPAMLPNGAHLTVYVRDHVSGLRKWKTYVGTGEGVAER